MPSATKAPRISERTIQETCSEMLILDGWRRIRTDMPQLRGLGVQEPGMADDLFIRYAWPNGSGVTPVMQVCANVMFVEWKRSGGNLGPKQDAWHAQECARGALTVRLGIDCEASIKGFHEWYGKSGLNRKLRLETNSNGK